MSSSLFRRSSITIPTNAAASNGPPRATVSPPTRPSKHFPLMSKPFSSNTYIRGRGSFTERKPPHVILPITPTPPPLPPPPSNPQLSPLKPRSRSQQWSSSKAFGIAGLEKLPVRSHSVKAPAQRRNSRVEPPPRPIHRPRLIDEHKSHQETSAPSSSASSHSQAGEGGKILSSSQTLPANTSNLRQDVFRVTICVFHSSLLIVSYIAGTTFLILLLPAFCISYCIRQIGLLLAQHRRSSLVETLSSLSLHYLHGEDAGRNIVVVIYLGAPGIKIATLKKLLVRRIFSAPPPPSNTHQRRNCGSKGMERWFAERLQQTVVPLPTGYAWQRCASVNIDEHVVPAYLVGQNRPSYGRRLSPNKRPPEEEGMVESDKDPVEMLVGQLAAVGLPLDRPLWQVHLVEDYHDTKDALTVRRMDSPFSPSSWQEKDYLAPWRNSRPNTSPANDAMSVTSADCLRTYCRASPGSSVYSSLSITGTNSASRLASTPTGSLIVFRVHSAITDDAQSLVEFLTILLSEGAFDEETKSPTVNPQESGTSKIGEDDKLDKKRSSTGFKVRISESSFEWQDHPEKPPFAVANQPTPLRTYPTFFCDWLREINAVRREVMRALLLGPFLMLHNLMMVPADLGLLPSLVQQTPSEFETATSVIQKHVYRRIQLPLDKLLHIQKVTKASLSEISMSLLSGALRAYQQMSGMKKPPDLLIRTCTPTPNFEMCSERLTQPNYQRDAAESDIEAQEPEHNEAVTALSDIVNGPPAHCIYTLMQLPLSEEGMIPRLWRVHQRVTMLHRTALAVTLEWTRDLLHLLLPHWLALRADSLLLGGASKCSVTFAEVSLENTGNVEGSSNSVLGKRSKSGSRRKSKLRHQSRRGMANQSSLKMDISQALRLVNRPNSLNDSSNSSVYEGSPSNERNLDLIYLSGGIPIVRIEAWLANHRDASSINESLPSNSSSSSVAEYGGGKKSMCRNLAVVTCVYGSHLTVGVTANCQMDGKPGLDLILNTMLKQLNNLYKLIDSRFPAKPVIYAPRRRFHLVSGAGSSSVRMRVIQGSPRAQKRPSTSTISPQLTSTTIRESHSPDIMIGGELIEWNENQFLKYNFPPLSSGLRKSSLRKTQKRHSNEPIAVEETPSEEPTSTSKLVPILKTSSSVVPTETEIDEKTKRKRTSESLESNGKSKHAKKQRRLGISKKSKKHPLPKLPSPAPRRSQVRFATDDN